MTLIDAHFTYYEKLKPYTKGARMLMLGNQDNKTSVRNENKLFETIEYKTLDPDGGHYKNDIQGDLSFMEQHWDVVFNLGTLEHVWDVHTGYCNAAKLVKVGGYFIGHCPVEGYANHGVHVTSAEAIRTFFKINGFENSIQFGYMTDNPWVGRILWHVEKKIEHVTEFKRPQQVWVNGLAHHYE